MGDNYELQMCLPTKMFSQTCIWSRSHFLNVSFFNSKSDALQWIREARGTKNRISLCWRSTNKPWWRLSFNTLQFQLWNTSIKVVLFSNDCSYFLKIAWLVKKNTNYWKDVSVQDALLFAFLFIPDGCFSWRHILKF